MQGVVTRQRGWIEFELTHPQLSQLHNLGHRVRTQRPAARHNPGLLQHLRGVLRPPGLRHPLQLLRLIPLVQVECRPQRGDVDAGRRADGYWELVYWGKCDGERAHGGSGEEERKRARSWRGREWLGGCGWADWRGEYVAAVRSGRGESWGWSGFRGVWRETWARRYGPL